MTNSGRHYDIKDSFGGALRFIDSKIMVDKFYSAAKQNLIQKQGEKKNE